jgi:hypothetical protein
MVGMSFGLIRPRIFLPFQSSMNFSMKNPQSYLGTMGREKYYESLEKFRPQSDKQIKKEEIGYFCTYDVVCFGQSMNSVGHF